MGKIFFALALCQVQAPRTKEVHIEPQGADLTIIQIATDTEVSLNTYLLGNIRKFARCR